MKNKSLLKSKFQFAKRTGKKSTRNLPINKAFRNWQSNEKWLIVVPHDDDAVLGIGLTILAGVAAGVDIHVRITTDGHMGYCDSKQKKNISKIRTAETIESFKTLGVNTKQIKWLNFRDCQLNHQTGRYFVTKKTPSSALGADGLQNAYTLALREVRPTRLFVPTIADLHPDHKLTNSELMISLFHAGADIWPELGKATSVPEVVEFAVYCDYPSPPNIQLIADEKTFEIKLQGILAYKSQKQIKGLVDNLRANGAEEYLKEIDFQFYDPKTYRPLF